jgi:hypothetical protein
MAYEGKLLINKDAVPRKAEMHLQIVQMNLQWIENDEINLKKLNSS